MAVRASSHPALAAGEPDQGRLAPGYWADLMIVPAACVDEPTVPGGGLSAAPPGWSRAGEVVFEH